MCRFRAGVIALTLLAASGAGVSAADQVKTATGLIEGAEHYLDPLTVVGAGPVRLLPLDGGAPPVARLPTRTTGTVSATIGSGPRMRLAEGLP